MAKYSNISYFESRPDIVKIFDDLEAYRNYCVFEMVEFNEAAMYNRADKNWSNYEYSKKPKREWKQREGGGNYNRSGGSNYSRGGGARNFTR